VPVSPADVTARIGSLEASLARANAALAARDLRRMQFCALSEKLGR